MNYQDLVAFRDAVTIPKLMELFENTEIPEGSCYIYELEISYLDGRSCGFDSNIRAAGLVYHDGNVQEYCFDQCDIDVNDFLAAHKECTFMSDGQLRIIDELEELDIVSKIRNLRNCERFFPQLEGLNEFNLEFTSVVFEKMKYLMHKNDVEKHPIDKLIADAAAKSSIQKGTHGKTPPEKDRLF